MVMLNFEGDNDHVIDDSDQDKMGMGGADGSRCDVISDGVYSRLRRY